MPTAKKRPGIRRSSGHCSILTSNGAFGRPPAPCSAGPIRLFCSVKLQTLGHAGRKFAAGLNGGERVLGDRTPRQRSASILAAATASCTARLMPTPPIGDIA